MSILDEDPCDLVEIWDENGSFDDSVDIWDDSGAFDDSDDV